MSRSAALLLVLLAACAPPRAPAPASAPSPSSGDYGVLVMARGGAPETESAVLEAVAPLAAERPAVVAFGTAERASLAAALDSLAALGVARAAVVRLFVSGAAWAERTRWLLGLSDRPPSARSGEGAAEPPVEHGLRLATHEAGLMDAPEAVRIVSERAAAAATNPTTESLLIIARGMEDDAEDAAVVAAMNEAARAIGDVGFARIGTATLREDWPAERAVAEQRILDFVRFETSLGRRVIVLPYRLDRFGAAADALGASDYVATDGLLPHPAVTAWIERTAAEIACREGWTPADACAAAPARAGTP